MNIVIKSLCGGEVKQSYSRFERKKDRVPAAHRGGIKIGQA